MEECERLGVPVLISTGHGLDDIPIFCQHLPILTKPFLPGEVLRLTAKHSGAGHP